MTCSTKACGEELFQFKPTMIGSNTDDFGLLGNNDDVVRHDSSRGERFLDAFLAVHTRSTISLGEDEEVLTGS